MMAIAQRYALTLLLLINLTPIQAWEGSFAFDFSGGSIKGFTQIPRGGDYFSTSYNRPTFEEVDLNRNFYWGIDFGLKYKVLKVFFEFDKIKAEKRNRLDIPLASHGQFMPAGVQFKPCVHYDWYRLGVGKAFNSTNKKWELTPLLIGNFLRFRYAFYSWPSASSRGFNLVTGGFGLDASYQISPKIKLHAFGSSTLPLSNLTLYQALFAIEYTLIQTPALKLLPRIGIEIFEVDYRDEQNIPNYFRYEAKPHIMVGFKLLFS